MTRYLYQNSPLRFEEENDGGSTFEGNRRLAAKINWVTTFDTAVAQLLLLRADRWLERCVDARGMRAFSPELAMLLRPAGPPLDRRRSHAVSPVSTVCAKSQSHLFNINMVILRTAQEHLSGEGTSAQLTDAVTARPSLIGTSSFAYRFDACLMPPPTRHARDHRS